MNSAVCVRIFEQAIQDYHLTDHVDSLLQNPYAAQSIEAVLYQKNWVDTVQWHLEDIIRDPQIDPQQALEIKRRIDRSNQLRTDLVEQLDNQFLSQFQDIQPQSGARLNTETPAWAIDRLSILLLKIYHMRLERERSDATEAHRTSTGRKLDVLLEQKADLSTSIDELLADIAAGRKRMKLYRQMKMYNDETLNPVLYAQKKAAL